MNVVEIIAAYLIITFLTACAVGRYLRKISESYPPAKINEPGNKSTNG